MMKGWRKMNNGYIGRGAIIDGKYKTIYLHRVIANAQEGQDVDHINGDKTDNSPENLRVCTRAENLQNSRVHKGNTSGYKGVCWDKQMKKWRGQIRGNGRNIFLGLFKRKEEAAMAYNESAKKLFGEFARLNPL